MTAPTTFFFGDSLTDNGNLLSYGQGLLDATLLESLLGPTGAISDGPTYAARASALLGWTEANHAVASAEAAGTQTLEDMVVESGLESALLVPLDDPALDIDINLGGQIDRFQAETAGQDLSGDAAVVMIGGNDFRGLDLDSPTILSDALAMLDAVLDATRAAVTEIVAQGMGTVWLADLPAIEFFASSSDYTESELALAQVAYGVQQDGVHEIVATFQGAGADVRFLEMSGISGAIHEDPSGFGLYAPYDQTMEDSGVLDDFDADQVAFYDSIHPSAATHGVLGAFTAAILAGQAALFGDDTGEALTAGDGLAFGGGGDDALSGDGAVLFGGSGDDSLAGSKGDEVLSGGSGNDQVLGYAGNDILAGGIGDDLVAGMGRNDVLFDSLGSDTLLAGKGDDVMIFTQASLLGGSENGTNTFIGGDGQDVLYLVLEEATADWISGALGTAAQRSALADLGVRVGASVEEIVVLEGREALAGFSGESWYDHADAWGLV